MSRHRALVVKDLRAYFDQPTGYVLLVLFVGLLSYLFFRSAFLTGEASLRPLFTLVPWFLAVLVPAATMRLLAEEERDGTMELLLTHPLREIDIVLSKFLAGFIFIALGLATTLGVPVLLSTAGHLDLGAIVAQYLGALLLAAAMVAIGIFASSLTRNQIVAFLVSLAIGLALLLGGLEFVFLPLTPTLGTFVHQLSLLTHFELVARGVLDLSDLLYFLAVILIFLAVAYLQVRRRSMSRSSRSYRLLQVGVSGLVLLSIGMGWLGTLVPGRVDLTEGRIYTLSPA
ncbi:MAG: ABC transporter permease subunit, partial [Chloroflexi bacterium]|nr:ABC transporter permease subunit [Chloroflexota bacterium]